MTFRQIEAARAYHLEQAIRHRRAALIARVSGRNPVPDEVAREEHTAAAMALSREIDVVTVRRIA